MTDLLNERKWVAQRGTVTGVEIVEPLAPKTRRVVCRIGGKDRESRAALIAAAPDMLEALERISVWLRNGDYDTRGGLIEMSRLAYVAEAAIRAAKGDA